MSAHVPVLTREVLDYLRPDRGGLFVDCTVGLGGHARALLEAGASRIIGFDRDADALAIARENLAPWRDRVELIHSDYRHVDVELDSRGVASVDGALADLGVSSMQLDREGRGFSFQRDEPLDMRMDRSSGSTAADLVGQASERELADIIFEYGEERFSRRIARKLVEARTSEPIVTTGRLAALVRQAVPVRGYSRIDPATRTFQAIRIWVNRELEGLDRFVVTLAQRLKAAARLVVISFHSLEDRIVKHTFRALQHEARGTVLTKKPVIAGDEEREQNPRARSAKLRAIEGVA